MGGNHQLNHPENQLLVGELCADSYLFRDMFVLFILNLIQNCPDRGAEGNSASRSDSEPDGKIFY